MKDLKVASKTRDAAAELLGRLLTRPDLQSKYLERFLAWSMEVLTTSNDTFLVCYFAPSSPHARELKHFKAFRSTRSAHGHLQARSAPGASRPNFICLPAVKTPDGGQSRPTQGLRDQTLFLGTELAVSQTARLLALRQTESTSGFGGAQAKDCSLALYARCLEPLLLLSKATPP